MLAAWARREITAALRPADSIRSTLASGNAIANARPGKPAPAPTSAIRLARVNGGPTSRPLRLSATWTSSASRGDATVVGGCGSAASASSNRRICSADPVDNPKRAHSASAVSRETLRARGTRAPG